MEKRLIYRRRAVDSLNELEGLLCALANLNPPPTAKFRPVLRFRIHETSDTAPRKSLTEPEAG
jgi:hypothetical protein